MLLALTHIVSPNLGKCELTHRQRQPIDLALATQQHAAYCDTLRSHGLEVIELDVNRDYPDSVFVEDTAVVVDELAVMANPGTPSRQGEVTNMEPVLVRYRPIARIQPPAILDGGDVLQVGKQIFVGLSSRTDQAGVDALADILKPFIYDVTPVAVTGCLHLKSAITAVDNETLLANPDWFNPSPFTSFRIIPVAKEEPWAANALRLDDMVYLAAGFPKTAEILACQGYTVRTVDISELQKAEAGLTCSSLIFKKNR
ncbi:N(G),N(G)-dimethylarginine dimethylaminohydrolase [subsurface metagenome]|nr:dimethylargininase [Dehalococcoidia bacterium]